jgi:hypothetical protein
MGENGSGNKEEGDHRKEDATASWLWKSKKTEEVYF